MCIKSKKAAYVTLGCRVNQYETQAIREELEKYGFVEESFDRECDLYLINTCAVTGESERKGRQLIRRALRRKRENPQVVICVCGCFAQGVKEADWLSQVDVLTGNGNKSRLASFLSSYCQLPWIERKPVDLRIDVGREKTFDPMQLSRSHNARAFVKIEDGCNSFCSYCYVPLVRGRVRSRAPEAVVDEVKRLCENGYREVVLTGIETGAYGEDFGKEDALISLVDSLHGIPGLKRIRFGSLKPSLFTQPFCEKLSSLELVMPHFHLSLQSGSQRVLSAMRRRYGRREEEDAIERIYRYFPDAGLSADMICGFPGETERDFQETVSLVQWAKLLHTHIFPYSPRAGTLAAGMKETVTDGEKKERCAFLLSVAKASSLSFAKARAGKEYRVLCEKVRDGVMYGYTENFLYTAVSGEESFRVGEIYPAVLEEKHRFSVGTLTVFAKSAKYG